MHPLNESRIAFAFNEDFVELFDAFPRALQHLLHLTNRADRRLQSSCHLLVRLPHQEVQAQGWGLVEVMA